MSNAKKVKDLMVEITEYPHIPYWLSVREAIFLIRSTYDEKSGLGIHRMVLVFDEKYQLLGVLTLKKLLIGIEPKFLRRNEKSPYQGLTDADYAGLSALLEGTFAEGCKKEAKKPVSEVMMPIKAKVDVNDSIAKAAFIMIQADINLIPVMEGEIVRGVLRMSDVFNELTKIVVE
ncbi:MAG: CBS domain-containing protein [Deltaproteobacteria bacterium]|jgi:CBS domain-containing protein|nr:CBS domain-containing protein [Deltaproteobacteria bacterium]MDL1986808.1 CBS domain-containing protein [Deltaproteobacteria bacterium]